MTFFKEELVKVKAFIFDVDGVLSKDTSPLNEFGEPVRTANVKDGYAIRNAINNGYEVAIITGGSVERVKLRYEKIGVKHIYMGCFDKMSALNDLLEKTGLSKENILYMGDDLVDYLIMKEIDIPVCPRDAVSEIKNISKYISDKDGGEGCVRDVIEQVMKAQGTWMNDQSYYWKST